MFDIAKFRAYLCLVVFAASLSSGANAQEYYGAATSTSQPNLEMMSQYDRDFSAMYNNTEPKKTSSETSPKDAAQNDAAENSAAPSGYPHGRVMASLTYARENPDTDTVATEESPVLELKSYVSDR